MTDQQQVNDIKARLVTIVDDAERILADCTDPHDDLDVATRAHTRSILTHSVSALAILAKVDGALKGPR